MKIKTAQLKKMVSECLREILMEEADVNISAGLSKSIEKLKELYIKKQTLVKKFKDPDTSSEQKEKIKTGLIQLAKQIKKQEEVFGDKIKDEEVPEGDDND